MTLDTEQQVSIRIDGPPGGPTLVYLPGLHGDWSLIGPFRKALDRRAGFIQIAYPDSLSWSLEDHAAAVETALAEHGISSGWVLGESFSSQVVWPLIMRGRFKVQGVILAGGFVRHPARWAAKFCGGCLASVPLAAIRNMLLGYGKLAPWRFRRDPETAAGIYDYIHRLTDRKRHAVVHRLDLLAESDFCPAATHSDVPVFALTGFWDPVVPWLSVRARLQKKCPALREFKVLWSADHNVLGTAPEAAAEIILKWMQRQEPAELE